MNQPKRYRKLPVEITAIQFTGDNDRAIADFVCDAAYLYAAANPAWIIHTLEGDMTAEVGDFIIRGVAGEFYPCKPDIFEATYQESHYSPDLVETDITPPDDAWGV